MERVNKKLLNRFTITVDAHTDFIFLNKYGLKLSGKTILKPSFHAVWELNDNLVGYRLGTSFGILDINGKKIIDPILKGHVQYSEGRGKKDVFCFAEEFYTKEWNSRQYLSFNIEHSDKQFLISKSGEIISNGEFNIICAPTKQGHCMVANNDKWGLFNIKAKKLIIETIHPHDYLRYEQRWDEKKDEAIITAITLLLGGKNYKFNERSQTFELIAKRK